jgi:hypothetical protein
VTSAFSRGWTGALRPGRAAYLDTRRAGMHRL